MDNIPSIDIAALQSADSVLTLTGGGGRHPDRRESQEAGGMSISTVDCAYIEAMPTNNGAYPSNGARG